MFCVVTTISVITTIIATTITTTATKYRCEDTKRRKLSLLVDNTSLIIIKIIIKTITIITPVSKTKITHLSNNEKEKEAAANLH